MGMLVPVIMACVLATSGCFQLPGVHILENTPDPIIGQWIGGELPASDLHIVLFENQTYFSRSFYLNQGEKTEKGTWSRMDSGRFITQPAPGNITSWVYDPTDDSVYLTGLPQRKYYRYKG